MHVGLGLEFKQMPILAEGLAEAAVHHDWWYTEFLTASAAEAEKALESRHSVIECFDEALKDPVITSCSSWDYCKQYQPPSEEYPEGRWFVTREPYRDGVIGLAKKEMARVAARFRVSPDDDLERATAEIINTSSMCLFVPSLLLGNFDEMPVLTLASHSSLHRRRRAAATPRTTI